MKKIYVDSSVVLSVLLEELNYEVFSSLISNKHFVYSSPLLVAEVFSALHREKLSFQLAELVFSTIDFIILPQEDLFQEYPRIFKEGYLRGADAFHLATALYIDPLAKNLTFLTADERQKVVAKKLGFKVLESV